MATVRATASRNAKARARAREAGLRPRRVGHLGPHDPAPDVSRGVKSLAVYCADVGSVKQGNFGWARAVVPADAIEEHRGGAEIRELTDALAEDRKQGCRSPWASSARFSSLCPRSP
jgi:hypothetical protein